MNWQIILIGILLYFLIMKLTEKKEIPNERTETPVSVLIGKLKAKGLSHKGALLATAHACVESFIESNLKSYGFNYWNFGKPSWWDSVWKKPYRLFARADNVRFTIGFASLDDAIDGYLQVLKRGRPTAYEQIFKQNPQVPKFLASLCPKAYGHTGNNYATACNKGYDENINLWYIDLLEHITT